MEKIIVSMANSDAIEVRENQRLALGMATELIQPFLR